MWMRAKPKGGLNPELNMKVVCNTCERKLFGMESVNGKYHKLIWKLPKVTLF